MREREGEKHQYVVIPYVFLTGDLAHNPGTCPDWESNWRPLSSQVGAQSPESHQPGLFFNRLKKNFVSGFVAAVTRKQEIQKCSSSD